MLDNLYCVFRLFPFLVFQRCQVMPSVLTNPSNIGPIFVCMLSGLAATMQDNILQVVNF